MVNQRYRIYLFRMSRPRTAQSRESLGSVTSCLSAFSLRSSQSSIDYGDGRRSNIHIEGIFKIEGKCFDVMLKDTTLKWSPVSLDPNSDEIETFELDIKSVCIGLRIRKLKSLRNHKSVIAGFSILIMNWETGKESNITFNNDDQGNRVFIWLFSKLFHKIWCLSGQIRS